MVASSSRGLYDWNVALNWKSPGSGHGARQLELVQPRHVVRRADVLAGQRADARPVAEKQLVRVVLRIAAGDDVPFERPRAEDGGPIRQPGVEAALEALVGLVVSRARVRVGVDAVGRPALRLRIENVDRERRRHGASVRRAAEAAGAGSAGRGAGIGELEQREVRQRDRLVHEQDRALRVAAIVVEAGRQPRQELALDPDIGQGRPRPAQVRVEDGRRDPPVRSPRWRGPTSQSCT